MEGARNFGHLNKGTVLYVIIRAGVCALKMHRVANIAVFGKKLPDRRATSRRTLVGNNNPVVSSVDR